MKKFLQVRVRAHITPKVLESELVEKAKKLAEKPELLLPICNGSCRKCIFEKTRTLLLKIQACFDNKNKLKSYADWCLDPLGRAYAATLLIAVAGEAPYLASIQLPTGKVSFALRGRAKREYLVGVQYYDNPVLKLFCVLESAKHGYHFYSTKQKIICTGLKPHPPQQFIVETINASGYDLKFRNGFCVCPHLREQETGLNYLSLKWLSAHLTINVCERCCSAEKNLYTKITERIAAPDLMADFKINATYGLICKSDCEKCSAKEPSPPENLIADYTSGELTDSELLANLLAHIKTEWQCGAKFYVKGNECFGKDVEKFVNAIQPSVEESIGLTVLLKNINSAVIVEQSTTASKLFDTYWSEYGKDILAAIVGNETVAAKVFETTDISKEVPAQIIKRALSEAKVRNIIEKLPKYRYLPTVAEIAHKIASTYRINGRAAALKTAEKCDQSTTQQRAATYAFLLCLGGAESKKWKYTKEEVEFGEFLAKYAEELLNADAKAYHAALQKLLAASGSTENIVLENQ